MWYFLKQSLSLSIHRWTLQWLHLNLLSCLSCFFGRWSWMQVALHTTHRNLCASCTGQWPRSVFSLSEFPESLDLWCSRRMTSYQLVCQLSPVGTSNNPVLPPFLWVLWLIYVTIQLCMHSIQHIQWYMRILSSTTSVIVVQCCNTLSFDLPCRLPSYFAGNQGACSGGYWTWDLVPSAFFRDTVVILLANSPQWKVDRKCTNLLSYQVHANSAPLDQ